MELITSVNLVDFLPKIKYADAITMAGSCFTEHIGAKLERYKYNVLDNPFGILYNPVSIARMFERIANSEYYLESELVFNAGHYHSMDHHGSYSGQNKESILKSINQSIERSRDHITKSKYVFISLGSAKVYRFKETGQIAGNCHKIPQTQFESSRISLSECETELDKITQFIKRLSPKANIIWTVSPVRHLKDGFEENLRSKSTLILAVDQHLVKHTREVYFPAYEIMMDQLRDYRYYTRDLIHPTPLAIDIIWEIFTETYIEPHHKEAHRLIEKVKLSMEHRLMNDDKEAISSFANNQLKNIDNLEVLYPEMDWKTEKQYFIQLIKNGRLKV